MGVTKIFLDASTKAAHNAWTSQSLGFKKITNNKFEELQQKYTLVHNVGVYSRLMKRVPQLSELKPQVPVVEPIAHDALAHLATCMEFWRPCQVKLCLACIVDRSLSLLTLPLYLTNMTKQLIRKEFPILVIHPGCGIFAACGEL